MSAIATSPGRVRAPRARRLALRLPFSRWHLVLVPISLVFVAPLVWLVLTSFMTNVQIDRFPPTIIPSSLHLQGYRTLFATSDFPRWFLNSTIVASSTVVSNLVFCTLAGYAFARLRFRGSQALLLMMLATLVVPLQLTMIPMFLLMKQLGLINSLAAVVIPSLATPFGVFLLRQFFMSLPRELEEAARIDGCSRLKILWEIVVPLARPALVTVGVLTFLGTWNDLLWPLIVLNTSQQYTLQLGLASYQGHNYLTDWSALMAGNAITVLPTLLIFMVGQKTFLRSVAASAVTG